MSDHASGADWPPAPEWPDVDVVMPIRNEAEHVAAAIGSIGEQAYLGRVRVILGIAPSDDGTESVVDDVAAGRADVVVVENPEGTTPAGLNAAIRAGSAPVVVRVDGHSRLPTDYIARAVEVLRRTGAGNVGGRQIPFPTTDFEAGVVTATSSWLGTGGARYRVGATEGPTDTVYLGVFDRRALEDVGLFDERLIRNQDYELNFRLREAGWVVWFDPQLWAEYRPRGSWRTLARQYFEYGRWKAVVIGMHPRSVELRQVIPPVGMVSVVTALLVGTRWRPALLVPIAYGAAVLAATDGSIRSRLRAAGALVAIHGAWTLGLFSGVGRGVGVRRPAAARAG